VIGQVHTQAAAFSQLLCISWATVATFLAQGK